MVELSSKNQGSVVPGSCPVKAGISDRRAGVHDRVGHQLAGRQHGVVDQVQLPLGQPGAHEPSFGPHEVQAALHVQARVEQLASWRGCAHRSAQVAGGANVGPRLRAANRVAY